MTQVTPLSALVGSYGWLALVAFVVAATIRLLKADKLNALLAIYSIPSIPKAFLPWLALLLGFVGGGVEARVGGASWNDSALVGAWGIFAGGGAVAVNETLAGLLRTVSPRIADIIAGRNAGPTLKNVPPTPAPPGSAAEAREVKAAVQVVATAPPPAIDQAVHAVAVDAAPPSPPKA